ncbi:MAG: hypothetical protein ACR2Q4_01505 [Geminicoccaceae bacterium]
MPTHTETPANRANGRDPEAKLHASATFGGWLKILTLAYQPFCSDLFTLEAVASIEDFRR